MKGATDLNTTTEADESHTFQTREALCRDITELIQARSEELSSRGFSTEMARFDCLMRVKLIVDELYDEFNVGHARKEWYREYIRFGT